MKPRYTRPEVLLADALDRLNLPYSMHDRSLPGTPDIVFSDEKMVVFVHGCYWHRHLDCRLTTYPKKDTAQWIERFNDNVRRDRDVADRLRQDGWWVYIAWECEILRRPKTVAEDVASFLAKRTIAAAS